MIKKCKMYSKKSNLIVNLKKRKIQNSGKTACQSGCHGNVKLNRQGLLVPNCSQINFRKSHQV